LRPEWFRKLLAVAAHDFADGMNMVSFRSPASG
jgi:hypothetical protein